MRWDLILEDIEDGTLDPSRWELSCYFRQWEPIRREDEYCDEYDYEGELKRMNRRYGEVSHDENELRDLLKIHKIKLT